MLLRALDGPHTVDGGVWDRGDDSDHGGRRRTEQRHGDYLDHEACRHANPARGDRQDVSHDHRHSERHDKTHRLPVRLVAAQRSQDDDQCERHDARGGLPE